MKSSDAGRHLIVLQDFHTSSENKLKYTWWNTSDWLASAWLSSVNVANVDVDIQRVKVILNIWAHDKGAVIIVAVSQIDVPVWNREMVWPTFTEQNM